MAPLFWAALVASGVAVASMAIFAARLTRRQSAAERQAEEFVPSTDPDDPWAAYRPRPFDDVERRRPRMWPAVAGVFGLVLVAGGVVGARQSSSVATLEAGPTTPPYVVDVKAPSTPDPTLPPTPAPTLAPTAAPVYHASAPAPSSKSVKASTPAVSAGAAPAITGSASCAAGVMHVTINVSGTHLAWFGLWVDGKSVKGGPISGSSYSTTYSKQVGHGDHTAEATADDAAHHHGDKFFAAHCA